jgi:hypothetical protein
MTANRSTMNQHPHPNGRDGDQALQARLQYLLDLDISPELPPEQRLLLAILRQSVVDYFDDDPLQQLDAALYFAHSPLYRATLCQFGLPETLLPEGVDLTGFRRREAMVAAHEMDPLRLETLVHDLSGNQLKVVMTMGRLPLPATTRRISLACQLSRAAAKAALEQLAGQGLVEVNDDGLRAMWSLGEEVRRLLAEVWGQNDHS